jgi:glycosyltransferase involved in cell wall biosynthesis
MLRGLLPYLDAITVFSDGVYNAVTGAFPQHAKKVFVLRHGIHSYPHITRMGRLEAKQCLNDYLLYDSDLDNATKAALYNHCVFTDPDKVIIGQAGFLDPAKQSEVLFLLRNKLENRLPKVETVAVRIGSIREESQKVYAQKLRRQHDAKKQFLLDIRLPQNMLPVAQRAFDINFYWPLSCTQSGILSHALGAGATIAGRDLEGAGEMLGDSGQIVEKNLNGLVDKITRLLTDPWKNAVNEELQRYYISAFSWEKQAALHYEIAEQVLKQRYAYNTSSPLSITAPYVPANSISTVAESYALV